MSNIDRGEFLKLVGLTSLGLLFPRFVLNPAEKQEFGAKENILIVVLDALSAHHISLYGYPRETMPNLAKIAEKAVVYNNHYSAGNFTSPGTASLLTGTLPWTHRAVDTNGKVVDAYIQKNIIHTLPDYYRLAYSHNSLTNTLLNQFINDIDKYTPRERLFLRSDKLLDLLFKNDYDTASIAWTRAIKKEEEGYSYSIYFSELYQRFKKNFQDYKKIFPIGVPVINKDNYFLLETAIDYMIDEIPKSPQPFFGYYHFLPPHWPYNTRKEFFQKFKGDNYHPSEKPEHLFSLGLSNDFLNKQHRFYDEYILYADAEFSRLYEQLEKSGILDNTWLVLTSDHGELFERGVVRHTTPLLNQAIIRVPLIIWEPARKSRLDVNEKTSAIDVLPTLLHVTGHEIPDWITGNVLPPYSTTKPDLENHIIAVESKSTERGDPISIGTIAYIKDQYKLIYYFGYKELGENGELMELYDIESDPEELRNLYSPRKNIGDELLNIIKSKLNETNLPYSR